MNGADRRVAARPTHGPHTLVQGCLQALVTAVFVVAFVAQPFRIPSVSMEPTLRVGDFVMMDKQAYAAHGLWGNGEVRRGDMIVFRHPRDPRMEHYMVKRVVALPGERVRLRDGQVLINGTTVAEPYASYAPAASDIFRDDFPALHSGDAEVDPAWWAEMRRDVRDGELTVPAQEYFVLGDNRNNSEDSRYWGFVPRGAIEGRPALVYFSVAGNELPGTQMQPSAARARGGRGAVRIVR